MDGQWTTTVQGDRFLLDEDGDGIDGIVFASDSALHAIANANTCHMDGTFPTAPMLFYQIVTLHAFVLGVMLPLVFVLLSNKEGNTYIRFFSLVKEKSASLGLCQPSHQQSRRYHTRLTRKANKIHPNIFEMVELFSQEEASSLVSILRLQSGQLAT